VRLHVRDEAEQLRLEWDSSNYLSTTVDATGNVTYALTGSASFPLFKFDDAVVLKQYTDAGKPTANATNVGAMYRVKDAGAKETLEIILEDAAGGYHNVVAVAW
jgi:YD repeat-containing protein